MAVKIAKRDYRKNGVLFRTVNGERKKFGREMRYKIKFSTELDSDTLNYFIWRRVTKHLKTLLKQSGMNYTSTFYDVVFEADNYIRNIGTYIFKLNTTDI